MGWLSLNGVPWVSPSPGSRELARFRFAHLGPPRELPIVTGGDRTVCHFPSDEGPPCRVRDLQMFQVWADQRRVGPHPGVELALGLFGYPPDPALFENYARVFWGGAVHSDRGLEEGVAEVALMIGDANAARRLSVAHTEDLVWFLASTALVITLMDVDRGDREDTTAVLPLQPLCLEVTKLATRCISLGKGLPTRVGESLTEGLWAVMREVAKDHSPSLYCDYTESESETDDLHTSTLF
jgi:hypothetical protein